MRIILINIQRFLLEILVFCDGRVKVPDPGGAGPPSLRTLGRPHHPAVVPRTQEGQACAVRPQPGDRRVGDGQVNMVVNMFWRVNMAANMFHQSQCFLIQQHRTNIGSHHLVLVWSQIRPLRSLFLIL